MLSAMWVYFLLHCVHRFNYQVFDLRDNISVNRDTTVWMCVIDDLLKTLIRKLVSIFEGPIVLGELLNSIIC